MGSTGNSFSAFCGYIRKYLPRRLLTVSNCGSFGADDYCELGSRFKAQHVKVMTWWVAYKLGKIIRDSVTCLNLEKAGFCKDEVLFNKLFELPFHHALCVSDSHSPIHVPSIPGRQSAPGGEPLCLCDGKGNGTDGSCWFNSAATGGSSH